MSFIRSITSLVVTGLLAAGCASASSIGNYSVTYKGVGSATETAEFNKAAEDAYKAEVTAEDRKRTISKVKVFIDSVPPEVVVQDNVVGIKQGSSAALVASVELSAVWRMPAEDADLLPAFQKAAESAGADVAFCPRDKRLAVYRCYLVKTAPTSPRPQATKTTEL